MSEAKLLVQFHSTKMLMTLDLNTLVQVLLDEFGECLELRICPMTGQQQEAAEDRSGPIAAVVTRFILEDHSDPGSIVRREDLESRIVHLGQK